GVCREVGTTRSFQQRASGEILRMGGSWSPFGCCHRYLAISCWSGSSHRISGSPWQSWNQAGRMIGSVHDAHRHRSYLADDFGAPGIESPRGGRRERVRYKKKVITLQFAPATSVSIPQLDKVDGAIEFRESGAGIDSSQVLVNLHKASRPQ